MCENDIRMPPRKAATEETMMADAAALYQNPGIVGPDCADHVYELLDRVRELEASRLTRKMVEDAAASLFVSNGEQQGHRLYLIDDDGECELSCRELPDVVEILCKSLQVE